MPRHPKPENRDNPMRKLRALLSTRTDNVPITQDELSRLIDVPVPTIRAIEAGRRRLNPEVLRKVRLVTRFRWNEDMECWMWGQRPARPDDWKGDGEWMGLKGVAKSCPPHKELLKSFLHLRLQALLENVFDKDWNLLANRISDHFDACKDDFNIQRLEGFFRDTSSELAGEVYKRLVMPGPHANGGVDSVMSFIRRLPSRTQKAVEAWFVNLPILELHPAATAKTSRKTRGRCSGPPV
jgi:DNA-binding XRE family transcriptional regulator